MNQESNTYEEHHLNLMRKAIGQITIMVPEQVHESGISVTPSEFYSHIIVKIISNIQDVDAGLNQAGLMLKYVITHDLPISTLQDTDKIRGMDCASSYNIYDHSREDPISILEHIWNICRKIRTLSDQHMSPWNEQLVDLSNIDGITKYIKTIPDIELSEMNTFIDHRWLQEFIDIITPQSIIHLDYSTTLTEPIRTNSLDLVMKGLSVYLRDSREIKNFIIYNPILGSVINLYASELNYEQLKNTLTLIYG